MRILRNALVLASLLTLEALWILFFRYTHGTHYYSPSFYLWIGFWIPAVLVFLLSTWLVFRDDSHKGLARILNATAGGLVFAVLWMGIVGLTVIKVTGAGSLIGIKEGMQQPTSVTRP